MSTGFVLEDALRAKIDGGGKIFAPYVTSGLYGVDADLLREFEAAGADAIELGVPFSDPVVDGGVVQEASRRALEAGFHPRDAFELVREANLSIPVLLMGYLNPILAMGEEAWISASADASVSGFIVPDLPVDEGVDFAGRCYEAGLAPVFLAAPGTSVDRMREVAGASRGCIYCVATYGVTGQTGTLGRASQEVVETLRPLTDRPLLVGIGVSTPDDAAAQCAFADGVIVGSALVAPMLKGDFAQAVALARSFRAAIPR